ncbi:MAG: hypothetical protein LBJ82_04785 [Deltaproteobacteria bacterium]|jgi:type III secretion system chaperone SycN|nr:hypothetical protein [Deltaproteobacteria bacterium]
MGLVESTLAELAFTFKLPGLAFNDFGVAALRLGERDMFNLELAADGNVLLSLIRPLPLHRQGIAERILRLCGENAPIPLRAGTTRDGRLILTTRLTERTFTLQETMRRLALLREAHDKV